MGGDSCLRSHVFQSQHYEINKTKLNSNGLNEFLWSFESNFIVLETEQTAIKKKGPINSLESEMILQIL